MIIGVTDEAPSLVDGWVARNKPTYPIVCLENGDLEDFLGVRFFPTAAVVDPEGKLTYAGSAGGTSGPLKKALAKADKSPLFGKTFAMVTQAMQSGDYAKSYGLLSKLIENGKLDPSEAETAAFLRAYLDGLASKALGEAQGLREEGLTYAAVLRLEPFADPKADFLASPDARALLKKWESEAGFKAEMSGGKKLVDADALRESGDFVAAFKAYRSIAKKFDEQRIGALALERAKGIIEGGRAGWKSSCPRCKANKQRRACGKHHVDLKL